MHSVRFNMHVKFGSRRLESQMDVKLTQRRAISVFRIKNIRVCINPLGI